MTENKNRVCCLYRVSTDKQVDFNSNHEADLPMQRKACHKFAEAKGWVIVHKYVYEGYGAQRIATYLNNAGYRARSGKCWHPGSLRGMVGNLTYMGVLRCGDARSELMPELQIIPQEEFEAAQRIREDRSAHAAEEAEHHVPLRTRGQALLSNNVYCGPTASPVHGWRCCPNAAIRRRRSARRKPAG